MITKSFTVCIAAFALMSFMTIPAAKASPPNPQRSPIDANATIDDGQAQPVTTISRKGRFECVGLKRDQMVSITVQYPAAMAGHSINAEPLDGGKVVAAAKDLIVGPDGVIFFRFHAGHDVGVYQIALHDGARELGLQFWVLDEDHPERNPHVVNSN